MFLILHPLSMKSKLEMACAFKCSELNLGNNGLEDNTPIQKNYITVKATCFSSMKLSSVDFDFRVNLIALFFNRSFVSIFSLNNPFLSGLCV